MDLTTNGFMTKVWGPPMWMIMHMITLNYTEKKKKETKKFFESLTGVLPCKKCRSNYTKIIRNGPLKLTDAVFKNRNTLSLWLFKVHNQVQKDIFKNTSSLKNKPEYTNSQSDYQKAMKKYERFRAKCKVKDHGCITPAKGASLRSEIHIKKNTKSLKAGASVR